jgi:hypothetical protein
LALHKLYSTAGGNQGALHYLEPREALSSGAFPVRRYPLDGYRFVARSRRAFFAVKPYWSACCASGCPASCCPASCCPASCCAAETLPNESAAENWLPKRRHSRHCNPTSAKALLCERGCAKHIPGKHKPSPVRLYSRGFGITGRLYCRRRQDFTQGQLQQGFVSR